MNKLLIVLAVIADVALVVNVYRHWEDKVNIQINCTTNKGHTVCLAHNPIEE